MTESCLASASHKEGLRVAADAARLGPAGILCIAVFGASLLTVQLGSGRVLTYHETVFAQPAKEMISSGNWLVPTIGGAVFPDKPPVTHWSIAAAMTLLGTDAEWAVRLPMVLAALVTAIVMAALAASWFGRRVGLCTGLVQMTAYYVLMQARLAEADMLLCLWVVVGYAAFAKTTIGNPPGRSTNCWLRWTPYAAAGMAFLTKGPIGLVLIIGGAGLYSLWSRERTVWRAMLDPVGWLIIAASVTIWPLWAYAERPEIAEGWLLHNWDRFRGGMGGEKTPFFYLYMIPLLFLPWSVFVPSGLAAWVRRRDDSRRFLEMIACWFVCGFVVITAAAWKHKHYAIPVLPPLAIFAGLGLERTIFTVRTARVGWRATAIGCLIICAATIGAIRSLQPELMLAAGAAAVAVCVGMPTVIWLLQRDGSAAIAALFATVWFVDAAILGFAMPQFDSYRQQAIFAKRVNAIVPVDDTITLLGVGENQITYYVRAPWQRVDEIDQFVRERAKQSVQSDYILAPQHVADSLGELGHIQFLDRCPSIRKTMSERDRFVLIRTLPKSRRLAMEPGDSR